MSTENINIKNRKASFEYAFIETFTAGMQLTGTEIKSIREGKASIADAFCVFQDGELWVRNMNIAEYKQGSYLNHDPMRLRKLLLKKNELKRLLGKIKEQGLTIIATRMFINDRGFAKLDIALAKGKKMYDKRQDLKLKDAQKQMKRVKM